MPVVVRDGKGQPVGDLNKEDFQLFDRGKPQAISSFAVEKTATRKPGAASGAGPNGENKDTAFIAPDLFVAYLFDDIHLKFSDLGDVRSAAGRRLDKSLEPGSRWRSSRPPAKRRSTSPTTARSCTRRCVASGRGR